MRNVTINKVTFEYYGTLEELLCNEWDAKYRVNKSANQDFSFCIH